MSSSTGSWVRTSTATLCVWIPTGSSGVTDSIGSRGKMPFGPSSGMANIDLWRILVVPKKP